MPCRLTAFWPGRSALVVQAQPPNTPRWPGVAGGFHEAWFVAATDPQAGCGLWLRYAVDVKHDALGGALWASWFERDAPHRTFALQNPVDPAAIGRGEFVQLGSAHLSGSGCSGEVEAGGHALRWRLAFGRGAPPEEAVPGWLAPIARLRGSGYVLPHPAMAVTGAMEVDGRSVDLQQAPAMQGHLWGRSRWPAWAWARCSAFAEDPDASIDLLDAQGPAGVRFPMFTFRFRGAVHRFAELPWMPLTTSVPVAPTWHFSAQDARLAIDGVVRAPPEQMVQVQYVEPDDSLRHCIHTALAWMEVRVRSRAFPGAPWRPETTLTSKSGASLEFCGREHDERVLRMLVSAPSPQRIQSPAGSVAS